MWKGLLRDCEIFVFFLTFGLIILQWGEAGEENSEGEQGEEAGEEHVGLVDVAGLVDSVDIVDVIYILDIVLILSQVTIIVWLSLNIYYRKSAITSKGHSKWLQKITARNQGLSEKIMYYRKSKICKKVHLCLLLLANLS